MTLNFDFSSRHADTRCVMIRGVALFFAVLLAVVPAGVASAQLEAPQGLAFADIPAEIKTLVEQLYRAPQPAGQGEAATKLAAMGEGAAPAVTYLVGILNEKIDPAVRQAVITTLGKIGKPVVEPITACLKSDRQELRINAIEILETIADAQAGPALTNTALHDASQPVRDRALEALVRLAKSNPAVGETLMTTVQDEKAAPEIRSRAMKAMGRLAGTGMPPDALIAMVENAEADIRLRCAAAAALGQTRTPAAIAPLVKALGDKIASMRVWAAVALNGNSSSEAITALTKALQDEDERVRVRAADALAAVLDPKVVDPLVKAVNDTNAEVRTWAVIGLGNYDDKKAIDTLSLAIGDSDVKVRLAAADSLGRTGSPLATPYLISRLNDFGEEVEVRAAAARALGALRDSRAVPALLGLIGDANPKLRQWVVSALGRIGDARAVEPLIGALADGDPTVRGWAAMALSRFSDLRIVDPLVKAVKDPEAQVRLWAVLALRIAASNTQLQAVIPQIKAALDAAASDPDPAVQQKAKQVLGTK